MNRSVANEPAGRIPDGSEQMAAIRARKQRSLLCHLKGVLHDAVTAHPGTFSRGDRIYLFGSRATGEWDGYSDIDILVVFADPADRRRHDNAYAALAVIADDLIVLQEAVYADRVKKSHPFWTRVDLEKQLLLEVA